MSSVAKPSSVAVVDIGSNSIKVLVARRGANGAIAPVLNRTIDARIGAGISETEPRLSDEGMMRGLGAIRELLMEVAEHSPKRIVLVATSAVRDAKNGAEFRAKIRAATKQEIRVLSGSEEAALIGRGLTTDPTLRDLKNFYVFDLGGGSLECLSFRDRKMEQAASLQLGCVRLMELFVPDPAQPFPPAVAETIRAHTQATIAAGGFKFWLPADATAVGTGGTVTTVRAIIGALAGKRFDRTDPIISVAHLRELLGWLGPLSLPDRQRVPGLPPPRADVFPAALATLIAIAELGGFSAYRNSLHNLRYGLADEALG